VKARQRDFNRDRRGNNRLSANGVRDARHRVTLEAHAVIEAHFGFLVGA